MKGKVFLKRPKVDWNRLRLDIGDQAVDEYYWSHFISFLTFKVSLNRLSYLALLHVYGKARLDAYRYSGVWSV